MQRGAVDAFLVVVLRDHVARTYELKIELYDSNSFVDFVHLRPSDSFTLSHYLTSFLTQAWRLMRVWNSSGLGATGSPI
jgi:hypothetical protein